MNDTQTLYEYVHSKGITMQDFAKIVDLSVGYLYTVQHNRDANFTIENIRKIYHATEKYFGEGLDCWDYLNK